MTGSSVSANRVTEGALVLRVMVTWFYVVVEVVVST